MIVKIKPKKVCDICSQTVALKRGLTYKTMVYYYTIRRDDVSLKLDEDTKKSKAHICADCWLAIRDYIRDKRRNS